MIAEPHAARLEAASAHFKRFFEELRSVFFERDDVLDQIALSLLCREHALIAGPPGTAKSHLASAVLGRVLDESTGRPSLFSRQFTESTVQTDLVGPIDFKTLMATGRTEHFTDEGMLGAVHAFLDEVFDGRDNLLRGTLNVLHERELKQGTKTTRGLVECAIMTSNRYVSDVLESSRSTLLAFIDRVAFIGFVPRGFADPDNLGFVLRRQLEGGGPRLEASLTVQDLDALQAAVDATWVAPEITDALAKLLGHLDVELADAARADENFVPTRYFSTRTAVRSGRILKAICVLDRITKSPGRSLEVQGKDLERLRLHLLLSGPSKQDVVKLLARETDPNERRQLEILKTEREIFDRSLAKIGHVQPSRRPEPPRVELRASAPAQSEAEAAAEKEGAGTAKAPETEAARRARLVRAALDAGDLGAAAQQVRELSAEASRKGAGLRAEAWLGELGREIASATAAAALSASGGASSGAPAIEALEALAAKLELGSVETRGAARWLRGRALALVDEALRHAPGASAAGLEAAAGLATAEAASRAIEERLVALERLGEKRRRLIAEGADLPASPAPASPAAPAAPEIDPLASAAASAEEDLAALCDVGFRAALAAAPEGRLEQILASMLPELERLDALSARLSGASGVPASLKARVAGPRLGDLVGAVAKRLDGRDKLALAGQVERILSVLRQADLAGVIPASAWLIWTAEALLRAEGEAPPLPKAGPRSLEGYRAVREEMSRTTNAYALSEVVLKAAPAVLYERDPEDASPEETGDAPFDLSGLRAALARIPDELRSRLLDLDLARLERGLAYLEAFWQEVEDAADRAEQESGNEKALREIVRSRFFTILLDERAPDRLALEAELVAELFPEGGARARELRTRMEALEHRAGELARKRIQRKRDAAWRKTLGGRVEA